MIDQVTDEGSTTKGIDGIGQPEADVAVVDHNVTQLRSVFRNFFRNPKLGVGLEVEVDGGVYAGISIKAYVDLSDGRIVEIPDRDELEEWREDCVRFRAAVDPLSKVEEGSFRGIFYIDPTISGTAILTGTAQINLLASIHAYNMIGENVTR